jgi:hypothetical protein
MRDLKRQQGRCYRSASHWHRSVLSYFILGQYGYIHKDSRKISIFTRRDVEANEHKKEKSHFTFRTKQKSRNNSFYYFIYCKYVNMFLIINIMHLVCDIVKFLYASLRYCKPSFGKVNDGIPFVSSMQHSFINLI